LAGVFFTFFPLILYFLRMRTKLLHFWESLETSFWFLPLLIVLLAIGLSFGLIYLDSLFDYQPSGFFLIFYTGGAESARSILSTISGAMLGVASTVFSITLVALTLATSQFGPRLLRNFMHDRLNQVVLGTYVATFIYCLLVLRTVKSNGELSFVPNISILFAIILAIGNIMLLIVFIHHISVSIQADQVIYKVGSNLNDNIKRLFSEELGEEKPAWEKEKPEEAQKEYSHIQAVLSLRGGYLQLIDMNTLLYQAAHHDLLLRLYCKPGEYLVKNTPIIRCFSKEKIGDDLQSKLENAFILGGKRSPAQDAEFAVHQMVEIAARALSPGVNDPYTAISCIDKLCATMCYLTNAKFPSPYRYDDEGVLRVITISLDFRGMMDAAFHQIRQYGKDNEAVLIRLMEALNTINSFARTDEQKEAVQRHAKMVIRAAEEAFSEPNDVEDLKERFEGME